MTTIIHAAYEGSGCIRMGECLFDYRCRAKNRSKSKGDGYGGVLPKAARALIREGMDPQALGRVTREGTQVFEDATLEAWASIALEEPGNAPRGIRVVRYRPPSWQRTQPPTGGRRVPEARQAPVLTLASPTA